MWSKVPRVVPGGAIAWGGVVDGVVGDAACGVGMPLLGAVPQQSGGAEAVQLVSVLSVMVSELS
jgi:hypothetical protein